MDIKQTSEESLSGAMDFFAKPPLAVSEEESYMMKVHPTSSISNNAPLVYEFDIDDGHYADLSKCYHYVRYQILKADGTPIPEVQAAQIGDPQKVAPINYYSNTMFQNVELHLNGELVETSNNLYPYKSYLQTFLSHAKECKEMQLAMGGFHQDRGEVDGDEIRTAMAAANCRNSGLHTRFELSKFSHPFTTLWPLHLDFCTQNRYVLNRSNVKIRLTRVSDKFGLIANAHNQGFTVSIQEAYLLVRMVKPSDSMRVAVEQALQTSEVKYPMKKCEMRFFTFAGTSNTLCEPTLYSGHLPTRIALGLVETEALDGNYKKSPFNFKPFDVTEIDVKVNGKSVTNDPLKINLENNDYMLPYFWLYESTGGLFDNESIVSYKNYKEGNFIYVFDLTEDGEHGLDHFHRPKSGVISVDIRVRDPPGVPVSLVAMFEREIILTCNEERNYKMMG